MRKAQRLRWLAHWIVTVFALGLSGCVVSVPPPTKTPPLIMRTPVPMSSPSMPLPSATSTLLPSPMLPTITPSPMHTHVPPTSTPCPTLRADERQAFVREMLETNGGCELPCWWGIIPGETAWQAAKDFFASQGIEEIVYEGDLYYYFDPPLLERSMQYNLELHFTQRAGVVHSIEVHSQVLGDPKINCFAQDWRRYSLDQVLSRYGMPSQVRIHVVPEIEPGAPIYYSLALVYDHLGFFILYEGPAVYEPLVMRICPRFGEAARIYLELQAPRPGESVLEPQEEYPFPTLEEATGIDVKTFHKTFREAGAQMCLESPAEIWP